MKQHDSPRQSARKARSLKAKGGGERTRTADFYVANVALCQLSYTPALPTLVRGARLLRFSNHAPGR
jgi:hypothetical protein